MYKTYTEIGIQLPLALHMWTLVQTRTSSLTVFSFSDLFLSFILSLVHIIAPIANFLNLANLAES